MCLVYCIYAVSAFCGCWVMGSRIPQLTLLSSAELIFDFEWQEPTTAHNLVTLFNRERENTNCETHSEGDCWEFENP